MIFRVAALTLALLIGIGAVIPVTTNHAEAGAPKPVKSKKKYKKYKKYSKKWWRAYRQRIRRKNALQVRQRSLRLRRIRLANAKSFPPPLTLRQLSLKAPEAPEVRVNNLYILVEGKIKDVLDGDTFNIENRDGKLFTVRMLGINAPDINQIYGDTAKRTLSGLILGKKATVIIRKKDVNERFLGTVYADGEDINLLQIRAGMAWYFGQNGYEPAANDRKTYEQAEQNARISQKGLWAKPKNNNAVALKK